MQKSKAMRVAGLFMLLLLTGGQAYSKEWETFTALFDGSPGVVEVNTTLKNKKSISTQPFLVMTAMRLQKGSEIGLATDEEMPVLRSFSDSVRYLLNRTIGYSNAGIFTHEGVRINYFYVTDTVGLRDKFTSMYAKAFPTYTLGLTLKYEKTWDTYFTFLYPGDEVLKGLQKKRKEQQPSKAK